MPTVPDQRLEPKSIVIRAIPTRVVALPSGDETVVRLYHGDDYIEATAAILRRWLNEMRREVPRAVARAEARELVNLADEAVAS